MIETIVGRLRVSTPMWDVKTDIFILQGKLL